MIFGIGTDIVKVERFNNSKTNLNRLAIKILTDSELSIYNSLSDDHAIFLAKRWAAKEAVAKAFGTGISGNTKWKNIEVENSSSGAPFVNFYNELQEQVEMLKARCHLSISDEYDTVVAYSVIEYSL